MYDTTIHARTIPRHLTAADFIADKQLFNPAYRDQTITDAVAVGQSGFAATPLKRSQLRGKHVYQLAKLKDLLVARLLTASIRRITAVKQDNRQFIVACIKSLMSDGGAFRVYKYDIKNFYESVSINHIIEQLSSDVAFSGQSSRIISTLFADLRSQGIEGLPRGLSLSATLAEYLMRSFDRRMSGYDGVWYYARFVDDILVVARPDLDPILFDKFALDCLAPGLTFNKKSKSHLFEPWSKGQTKENEGNFDFLGYNFSISTAHRNSDNNIVRTVDMDIAESKVRRMKTRIARSLIQFKSDGDFEMLAARFRLLTSNFTFVDRKTGQQRISGIYYNYPLVEPTTSRSLTELDKFVRSAILHSHKNNSLRPTISNSRRQLLMRMTFRSGFENRRFFYFSSKRISELKDCWKYA